jgi:predicted transcriptional regulator
MPTSFTVRLDTERERKLSELTEDGQSRNAVIRYALDLAYRARIEDRMRRESAALLEDPADLAEIRGARAAMGAGDAW